jgi:hypothetical protein
MIQLVLFLIAIAFYAVRIAAVLRNVEQWLASKQRLFFRTLALTSCCLPIRLGIWTAPRVMCATQSHPPAKRTMSLFGSLTDRIAQCLLMTEDIGPPFIQEGWKRLAIAFNSQRDFSSPKVVFRKTRQVPRFGA